MPGLRTSTSGSAASRSFPTPSPLSRKLAFDLVVMDFLESPEVSRVDALRPAMTKVRPGGHLLLDDSDRPGYAQSYEMLAGWKERRFTGIKDEWPEACETTIFRRPK
jgi:hypothetical protein